MISQKGIRLECDNFRGSCWRKDNILECIKGHMGSLIDRDHINTFRIILEHYMEFRSQLHLRFIDFNKALDSGNKECIWNALCGRSNSIRTNVFHAKYKYSRIYNVNTIILRDTEPEVSAKFGEIK